jgi:hypothetical protein
MKSSVAVRLLAAVALLSLGGCEEMFNWDLGLWSGSGYADVDELKDATPSGTAFQRDQFKDYAYLARSFGDQSPGPLMSLANTYAAKALKAAGGDNVDPEEANTDDQKTVVDRLTRALERGRSRVPATAARTQADYDCWVLNSGVEGQERAARQCLKSLDVTLPQLEADVGASE